MTSFLVVVPSYDCAPWLETCLSSIEGQRYDDYDVCVVDDGSPCGEHGQVARTYCECNGWRLVVNERRRGPLFSRPAALTASNPAGDVVVCLVEGDDSLAHRDVLGSLRDAYERTGAWMTSGGARAQSTAPSRKAREAGYEPLMHNRRAEFARRRARVAEHKLYVSALIRSRPAYAPLTRRS